MERLASEALVTMNPPPPSKGWVTVSGPKGEIQTPSSQKVRKLYWILFRFDLQDYWDIDVQVSDSDLGGDGTWRVRRHRHVGVDASKFLDSMVKVRHGFAHQDPTQPKASTGMAIAGANGLATVQSHHAHNAVSGVLQLAVQSTQAVMRELDLEGSAPNWIKRFNSIDRSGVGLDYWLSGSPAEELIANSWRGFYPQFATIESDVAPIAKLDVVGDDLPYVVDSGLDIGDE